MEKLLSVENLSKSYVTTQGTTYPVLKDVSLYLRRGEIACLMGASGSGKSSLLRLLLGRELPDAGTITCAIPLPGPQIGYLAQGEQLLPWRTALQNVALGKELLGTSRSDSEVAAQEALSQVGLSDFMHYFPAELSGGMRQRVLLARLFVLRPKLLFLDEAFGQLDLIARRELGQLLKVYLNRARAGALIVTHSIDESELLADRVLVLGGAPATVRSYSLHTRNAAPGMHEPGQRFDSILNALMESQVGGAPCA